jgi:5'-nucleotidase
MTMKRPLILVTNDDGISSKGIRALCEAIQPFGDVIVVAPDSPQSGMGHAITINDPLRLEASDLFDSVEAHSCSGTPVDCVKLGISEILHRKPDLIVSGINHGANTATNVLYSGTMSAAIEGAMEGIPSIGFSLDSFEQNADFSIATSVIQIVIRETLENGIPLGACLNVNIPYVSEDEFKGIKVCRQANAYWEDRFDKRLDQFNRTYYWLTGDFKDQEEGTDTDVYWMSKGYATMVPTQFDMTAYSVIEKLENWNL